MRKILCGRLLLVALIAALAIPCVASTAKAPQKAEQMLADANALLNRGDDAAALSKVEQAVALAPEWPAPHASLGLLYQRQANETLSREHLTRYQLLSLLETGAPDDRLTRDIAEGEALLIYLTNAERAKRGIPLLMPDAKLAQVARRHSREMAKLNYFSHRSPDTTCRTPSDRFRQLFGFDPPCIAENLARMWSRPLWSYNLENLRKSHDGLMESDGHREAILWERPTYIGVGIAVNEAGDYWVTENFASLD